MDKRRKIVNKIISPLAFIILLISATQTSTTITIPKVNANLGDKSINEIKTTIIFDRTVKIKTVEVKELLAPSKPLIINSSTNNTTVNASKSTNTEIDSNPGKFNSSDITLLTKLVEAEAKGESLTGKIAVANVVLNRVNSKAYPSTIKSVIYQRGQFDPVTIGGLQSIRPSTQSIEAVRQAVNGRNVAKGALNFYNPKIASSKWSRSRSVITIIGNHVFTD
jgi:N-acetylmuramoyl-L-alanine amidase